MKIGDAVNRTLDAIGARWSPDEIVGLSGLSNLDAITGGWRKGELAIVAAGPAVGKTTLSLSMADNAAIGNGVPTAFFSLENSIVQIVGNLLVSRKILDREQICWEKEVLENDWERIERQITDIVSAPLFIEEPWRLAIDELESRIDDFVTRVSVRLVFVDYVQLMYFQRSEKEMDKILSALKRLAERLGIAIVLTSQLRNGIPSGNPIITQRELPYISSHAIEKYVDLVLFLDRPVSIDDGNTSSAKLTIERNRYGRSAIIDLEFDGIRFCSSAY